MRSGDLRHSIVIQSKVETSDGLGGFTYTWSDLYPCRAAIWPLSSKEQLDAMKLELKDINKIRLRHPKMLNITAGMRIVHNQCFCGLDETFNIVSILNKDKRNNTLDLLATEDI